MLSPNFKPPAEVNDDDDDLMPMTTPWELNFIGYTFEGQEEFIEAVGQIENEMTSIEME